MIRRWHELILDPRRLPEKPFFSVKDVNAQPQIRYAVGKDAPPEAFLSDDEQGVNDAGYYSLDDAVVFQPE